MSNESPENPKEKWKKQKSQGRAILHEQRLSTNPNGKSWFDRMRRKTSENPKTSPEEPLL
ncbi:hypothetical protein L0Y34_00035 [Candidatus Parcubacteria bacterium]|nr:hypothetical protein [Candidatus Parcubacteria bacterium]